MFKIKDNKALIGIVLGVFVTLLIFILVVKVKISHVKILHKILLDDYTDDNNNNSNNGEVFDTTDPHFMDE